jgi:hypothetical protein
MKMTSFLIYRHGSNAANQSMTPVSAVAIAEAETAEKAKEIAAENLTVYSNQFLSAVAEAELDDGQLQDWNEVVSRDAEGRLCGLDSIIL